MKKVLIVGMTQNPGGIENVIMNYYRNIDKSKIQFDFLCNTEKVAYQDEILSLGGKVVNVASRSKSFFTYKKEIKKLFKDKANTYSAIWVNFCNLTNLDYLKLAKKYGIKCRIIHSHNSKNMYSKKLEIIHKINKIFLNKYATDFWSCSEDATNWFYNKKILKQNKILIINNAINLEQFKYNEKVENEYRKKLGLENKFIIGHVGRFQYQKNHEFLIEIFNEIYKKNKNVHLLLIGQGEQEPKIKEKVKRLNIEEAVTFLGVRNDIAELMKTMNLFLFPSRFEGLGLVLIEAQAVGLPIVASKDVIPQSVKMTENFYFKSLSENAESWAKTVLENIDKEKQSEINISQLQNHNYDIKLEAKKVERFFEGK